MYEKIQDIKWEPGEIHDTIYEISQEKNLQIKTAFKTIYQVILGQDKGPRAGYFLSNLHKKFFLDRLAEAIK